MTESLRNRGNSSNFILIAFAFFMVTRAFLNDLKKGEWSQFVEIFSPHNLQCFVQVNISGTVNQELLRSVRNIFVQKKTIYGISVIIIYLDILF